MPDTFLDLATIEAARQAVDADGMLLIPDAYDRATCAEMVAWIEQYPDEPGLETHYCGSELRIWDAQRKHPLMKEFIRQCDEFLSRMDRHAVEAHTLLAIRNRSIPATDGTLQMGRWHIDSFRRQLKIFLFLGDVTAATGPFELIRGTHRPGFKARMAATGVYFRVQDLLTGRRAYTRLDDRWIQAISRRGYEPEPVLCSSGTVMVVDTSAIHRARPCFEGTRYALTAYYR